ncbi:hypothetical protein BZA77DRAFT_44607 [Pyronema omphalodes]|nr:hypothetical protein BZA77DRAFT_44607 [Pyronema omphalodes]
MKTTTHADIATLSVYVVVNDIIRMPVILGFEGFMAVVSDVLTVSDSDTVFYRPADGPHERLVWRPISVQEEFRWLLDLCGDGVVRTSHPLRTRCLPQELEGRLGCRKRPPRPRRARLRSSRMTRLLISREISGIKRLASGLMSRAYRGLGCGWGFE